MSLTVTLSNISYSWNSTMSSLQRMLEERLVGRTARDLQAFLVFSQHPAGFYCTGKPLKSVVY